MYKLDTQNMKWDIKVLAGTGPRGSNFVATVIQPDTKPLLEGEAHILCFGGVVGNIAQSNVYTLDVVAGEWDVPHLSGVNPRPRVEQGGLVYIAGEQNIVVIQGGWNGKNYIDDLDFLHLEAPGAPDPLERAINSQALSDFTIWDCQENSIVNTQQNPSAENPLKTSPSKTPSGGLSRITVSGLPSGTAAASSEEKDSIGLVSTTSSVTSNPSLSSSGKDSSSSSNAPVKSTRKCLLVNRIILAMRSTFFKTLFELEPQRKEFTLDSGTDFALFSAFIKYLYTDSIVPDLIDDTNASAFIDLFTSYAPKHRERVLEELVITRPAIKSTMNDNLAVAFNNPLFSDVQLIVQYKEEAPVTIYGHRAILCTRNEVFGTMFLSSSTGSKEASSNKESSSASATAAKEASIVATGHKDSSISSQASSNASGPSTSSSETSSSPPREAIIKGFSSHIFMELIRYIYTFEIDFEKCEQDETFIVDLLQAAHRYGVKGLQNMAIETITAKFTLNNVCSILTLADQLNIKKLIKSAASFVRSNFEAISQLAEYPTHQSVIQKSLDTFFPQ
jgi:hypothetical protein